MSASNSMELEFSRLLPDHDYRFQMGLWRGNAAEFFHGSNPSILAERNRWVSESPELYLVAGSESALREFSLLVAEWQLEPHRVQASEEATPISLLQSVARNLEPDFVLLSRNSENRWIVDGGAVCFPSWWSLPEKMGRTITETHLPVPGLNSEMEDQIHRFLDRIEPGQCWRRENWGLARSREFNLHPERRQPRLTPPHHLNQIWFRVEHQALVKLPRTKALGFGIRLTIHPLANLVENQEFRRRFLRALATMPGSMAEYKGIAQVKDFLLAQL